MSDHTPEDARKNRDEPSSGLNEGGEKNERPARLIDVAQLANVSRATAARALGKYGLVGDKTREKVLEAAQTLNYRTNDIARSMRSGRTSTIGVVIADIANSFFNNSIRAIIETATRYGYKILVLNTDDNPARELEAVHVLTEKRVDGLIVVPSSVADTGHLTTMGEFGVPFVLLDRRIEGLETASITTDDVTGSRLAIEHLLAKGHKNIGLLVAAESARGFSFSEPKLIVSTVADRVKGARLAMADHGLQFDARTIVYSQNAIHLATQAATALLEHSPTLTAILTTNEEMALGVITACRNLNRRLGQDISLISIDDTPWAAVFSPAISVVSRPIYALGEAAVSQLVHEIQTGTPSSALLFQPQLIARESVRDLLI